MGKTQLSNELVALATVKGFNELAKRAEDKAVDSLTLAWKAGELARDAKDSLEHGEWMTFVETHYIVDHKTVTRWMQFHANVPESKLGTVPNLAAGVKMLEAPKPPKPKPPKTPPKPTSAPPIASDDETEYEPDWDAEAQETAPTAPGSPPKTNGTPPKQYARAEWYKQWDNAIGPLVRLVNKIANGVGERHDPHHEAIQEQLNYATEEMIKWMGVK